MITNISNPSAPTQDRLPSIIHYNGRQAVSARELYELLGFALQHWGKWHRKNIVANHLAMECEDWQKLPLSGRTCDFALSLDFAKRLSMMARTERGEQIRNYFIQCERKAQEAATPRSQIELLVESVQLLQDQDRKLSTIEGRVGVLEAKSTTSLGYYSIAGYAALTRKPLDIKMAASLGAKAKAACRTIGAVIGQIPDPRFGRVNTYPEEILESVFDDFFADAHGKGKGGRVC